MTKYFTLRELLFWVSSSSEKIFPLVVVNILSLACNLARSPAASFSNPVLQNLLEILPTWPCGEMKSWSYPSTKGKSVCWNLRAERVLKGHYEPLVEPC